MITGDGVIQGEASTLDITLFVECSCLFGHERCSIVQHHATRDAKRRKELTHDTDDCCRSPSHLPKFEPLHLSVDHNLESAVFQSYGDGVSWLRDAGSTADQSFAQRSVCLLINMAAVLSPLDVLFNFVTPQSSHGTILQSDNATITCMYQCHGLCTSRDAQYVTVSPSDAFVGDSEF